MTARNHDQPDRQHAQKEGRQESEERNGRSVAEWTTLIIGVVLIVGLVGLVTYLYVSGGNQPPAIVATPLDQEIRHEEGAYFLPIAVTNRGDQTAEDVMIQAELAAGQEAPEMSEFTIDFLAGGETEEGTAVFSTDPLAGELTIDVASFRIS